MRNLSIFFILYLFLSQCIYAKGKEVSYSGNVCNTNLLPTDKTSKYIAAIQCLNNEITALQSALQSVEANAAAATAAANRAANSAAETNQKLDRMFNRSMMR